MDYQFLNLYSKDDLLVKRILVMEILDVKILKKRLELHKIINRFGVLDNKTIKTSEELDLLIIRKQKDLNIKKLYSYKVSSDDYLLESNRNLAV